MPLLGVQIFLISCSFFWKIWPNHMLASPGELAPPPQENPGSTTALISITVYGIFSLIFILKLVLDFCWLIWASKMPNYLAQKSNQVAMGKWSSAN